MPARGHDAGLPEMPLVFTLFDSRASRLWGSSANRACTSPACHQAMSRLIRVARRHEV